MLDANDTKRSSQSNVISATPFIDNQLLKPSQAAKILGISERTLRRRREEWGIPRVRVGTCADGSPLFNYRYASLVRWMNEREVS